MDSSTTVEQATRRKGGHWPGEPAFWTFIFGDMLIFGIIFVMYAVQRVRDPQVFIDGHLMLNQNYGLLNTFILLFSSWLVATAVRSARNGQHRIVSLLLFGATACGLTFCVIKFFEYREKIAANHLPDSSEFWSFYYVVTAIHLIHVVFATLTIMVVAIGRLTPRARDDIMGLESAGVFWHLVDLLWIMLFALVYLVI